MLASKCQRPATIGLGPIPRREPPRSGCKGPPWVRRWRRRGHTPSSGRARPPPPLATAAAVPPQPGTCGRAAGRPRAGALGPQRSCRMSDLCTALGHPPPRRAAPRAAAGDGSGAAPSACMGRHPLRQALGKDAPGAFGVAAVEPSDPRPDLDTASNRRQVSRTPTVAAVHGTARAPAARAAAARSGAACVNMEEVRAVRRDSLDAAARHGKAVCHGQRNREQNQHWLQPVNLRHDPHKVRENHEGGEWSARASMATRTRLGR